jgi:hypothetical protein
MDSLIHRVIGSSLDNVNIEMGNGIIGPAAPGNEKIVNDAMVQ